MELREYIQIIFKHIRIIIIFTVAAFAVTMAVSYNQTPIYQSESKYVVGIDCARTATPDDCVYAFEALTGRQRIFVTNCDIMKSSGVFKRAFGLIGLDLNNPDVAEAAEDYVVECSPLPESMVIMLVVQGTTPNIVQELNRAIGIVGIEAINERLGIFPVSLLDDVIFDEDPVSPNHFFNGVLGLALGVLVSVTLVLLLDYLRTPQEKMENISIYDPRINVYNSRYLQRRLNEEIQRSRMQHRLLAIALVHLTPDENFVLLAEDDQELLLRKAAERMKNVLRETDILAYRGNNTFGVMMPETSEQDALMIFKKLHEVMRDEPVESDRYGYIINFTATTGLVENNGGTLEMHETMDVVLDALQKAMSSGANSIEFVRTKPSAFTVDETELEHVHFDLTDGGDMSVGRDPHKTQPLPPMDSMGNPIDKDYLYGYDNEEEDISFDTPVPKPLVVISERSEASIRGDEVESPVEAPVAAEDDQADDDDSLASREERLLKERLVKRIRERQAKKSRQPRAN
jgi:diguanylate cyclase (GGDEF)-like protein